MEKKRLHKFLTFAPLMLVITLSLIYGLFLGTYMECRWGVMRCQKLNVTSIYLPDSDVLNRYPEDRAQSIKDVEKQLEAKVQKKAAVTRERIQKAKIQDEMQGQILDGAILLRSSEVESAETQKLETTSKRAEKVRDEAKESVDALGDVEKKLDEEITALNSRLANLHNTEIQRYTKRLTWILFSGMFVVACLGALVVAFLVIYQIFSAPTLKRNRTLMLLVFICILLGYALFRFSFDFSYTSTFESLVGLLENDAAKNITPLVNFFDVIGSTVVLALLLAATVNLWHPKSFFDRDSQGLTSKLQQLGLRRKYLRLILYSGTIVLVIGIIRVRVLLDWLLTYSLSSALQTSVDDFNKVLISSLGVFYTVLLVAVYVPGRFIILDRAEQLAAGNTADQTKLQDEGFGSASTLSFKELLPRLVALLAPFLIGPVAELLKTAFQ